MKSPREHAEMVVHELVRSCDREGTESAVVEAAIRSAGEPLAAALRALVSNEQCTCSPDSSDLCGACSPLHLDACAALAAWEGK